MNRKDKDDKTAMLEDLTTAIAKALKSIELLLEDNTRLRGELDEIKAINQELLHDLENRKAMDNLIMELDNRNRLKEKNEKSNNQNH